MRIHFINTTNGIEALPDVLATGEPWAFCRICSTTLESKNYMKLLQDLDHNLLMHLAIGSEVIVYDRGCNKQVSRALYSGVPLIEYCLNRYWHGLTKAYRYTRTGDVKEDVDALYNHIYERLFVFDNNQAKTSLKTKLNYYRKFLRGSEININTCSSSTIHDGDYPYYKELLHKTLK